MNTVACPACGGPLPRHARWLTTTCRWCGAAVANGGRRVQAADHRAALRALASRPVGGTVVAVEAERYLVRARLAEGPRATVLFAERVRSPAALVILKLHADEAAARRAEAALRALARSEAQGAELLARRAPQIEAVGRCEGQLALVTRYSSGFSHSLDHVRLAHPGGLDPRHAVWIGNRVAELLDFAHRSGIVHGAVEPGHVIVQARDHGASLISWSQARLDGAPGDDLTGLGRILDALSPEAPAALQALWRRPPGAARTFLDVQKQAARAAFGPSAYLHLPLPGWGR